MSETSPAPKSLAALQAGTFAYGDRIQLTDPKGKMYSLTITAGKEWHTHKGWIVHDELVGIPEGSVISTTAGLKFTAFKPKNLPILQRQMWLIISVKFQLTGVVT